MAEEGLRHELGHPCRGPGANVVNASGVGTDCCRDADDARCGRASFGSVRRVGLDDDAAKARAPLKPQRHAEADAVQAAQLKADATDSAAIIDAFVLLLLLIEE